MEQAKVKPKARATPRAQGKAKKLSKEQILIALQKKKECNARAQDIVEKLLDPLPEDKIDYFLSNLIHINQAHYEDIVEERSITTLCGYPLCDKRLEDIPKQQYIISRAHNKVYDITERKKFCSNQCYKSSEYLKEQILTTPLWAREDGDLVPEFKLLSFKDQDSKDEKEEDHKDSETKSDEIKNNEIKNNDDRTS